MAKRGKGGGDAPVIIKRGGGEEEHGHHGGAWKIAYADFVTAMVKGDSNDHFALKVGDAQRGRLATLFDGPRPDRYSPMKKQARSETREGRKKQAVGWRRRPIHFNSLDRWFSGAHLLLAC